MNGRDTLCLKKIIQYAGEADYTISEMSLTLEKFTDNIIAKNAIAMCILQIGELAANLTLEFTLAHRGIPWRAIKDMRNRAAHGYGEMDVSKIWVTAVEDLPELRAFCERVLEQPNGR
ncbi:MAG: DUF86 domain-containing protein [Oscillospiraceae bacterium]|jgi:uncharacterized protein with HEPN domain|nr:DUF86 domain-containing protein [Oscillospiraceae bacterium]